VIDPALRLAGVSGHNIGRAGGVERRCPELVNPAAVDRQPVLDELRFARYPRERFDALVLL
jgi:hypothetical protein